MLSSLASKSSQEQLSLLVRTTHSHPRALYFNSHLSCSQSPIGTSSVIPFLTSKLAQIPLLHEPTVSGRTLTEFALVDPYHSPRGPKSLPPRVSLAWSPPPSHTECQLFWGQELDLQLLEDLTPSSPYSPQGIWNKVTNNTQHTETRVESLTKLRVLLPWSSVSLQQIKRPFP